MKTYKNLFDQIIEFGNLYRAASQAKKGKRETIENLSFHFNLEAELLRLSEELSTKRYRPGAYRTFTIFDPKTREISAAPYRDRVVHHALCQIIEPLIDRSFIFDSYANRVGKGTHKAISRFQYYARRFPYVLKCDIRKFFPSLSRAFMKSQFRRHIACEDTLWLMDLIVDSAPISQGASQDASKGLPIGNLTSQFWANLYMNPLDHFMKEELGVPGYIRYVDDFVLFHPSRVQLRLLLSEVETFVHKMKLNLHPNKTHIYQTHQGVPFLGFLIFPHYRWVQKARVHRFKRHLKKQLASQVDQKRLVQGVNSWLGHIRFGQSYQREMQTFAYLQQKGLNLFRRPSGSWGLVDQQ